MLPSLLKAIMNISAVNRISAIMEMFYICIVQYNSQ